MQKQIHKLHDFSCPLDLRPTCVDSSDGASPDHGTLVQSGTTLYGMTTAGGASGVGIFFSLELTGDVQFTVLHNFGGDANDGQNPFGSLLLNGTTLYGTTNAGGTKGMGTVFQINTDGTNYARVHDFAGGATDGANPIDNVILVNNTLYGMTQAGGLCDRRSDIRDPVAVGFSGAIDSRKPSAMPPRRTASTWSRLLR